MRTSLYLGLLLLRCRLAGDDSPAAAAAAAAGLLAESPARRADLRAPEAPSPPPLLPVPCDCVDGATPCWWRVRARRYLVQNSSAVILCGTFSR